MKVPMLTGRTSRFEMPVRIRKIIFLILSLAAIVCGILGSLYFQLLLNKGFDALIAWAGIALVWVFTIVVKILSKKDDYKRTLSVVYTATNPDDAKTYKSLKDLVAKCESATKETLKGYSGYTTCLGQNKELIGYMTTGRVAFPQYQGGGLKAISASLFLKPALGAFKHFAMIDFILSGQKDNSKNRIMASTKWYPRWQTYSKSITGWLLHTLAPFVAWLIISPIVVSVIDSMLDVNSGIMALIWFGLLGIILQLKNFSGARKDIIKITSDYTEKQIPQADFNICVAFADVSPEYKRICVDSGFIQSTQEVPAQQQEVIESNGAI